MTQPFGSRLIGGQLKWDGQADSDRIDVLGAP
jgi:hypothetical protein